jgi:hypothetical protein
MSQFFPNFRKMFRENRSEAEEAALKQGALMNVGLFLGFTVAGLIWLHSKNQS